MKRIDYFMDEGPRKSLEAPEAEAFRVASDKARVWDFVEIHDASKAWALEAYWVSGRRAG